jgi:membrane protease YdiL (CAAX protease family)
MAEHPVAAYFMLAIIGPWVFQLPMILSADGLGLFQYQVPFPIFLALFLLSAFAGPTGGAVAVTNALEGRAGVTRFFRRYAQWRVGILPYLLVLFGFPLIWLIALISQTGLAPLQGIAVNPATFFTTYLVGLLVFPAIIQWGEEPGWRGFALTRLQQRYSPLLAALVVGAVHGFWHLPNFLMTGGPNAAGPFNAVNFAMSIMVIMLVSIIFSWVFNRANQSILIAVLIHSSLNAAQAWAIGLVPNLPPATAYVLYALFALVAVILIVATRGRLGYRPQ